MSTIENSIVANQGYRGNITRSFSDIIFWISSFFLTLSLFALEIKGFAVYFSFIYIFDLYVINYYLSRVIKKFHNLKLSRLWWTGAFLIAFTFIHTLLLSGVTSAVLFFGKIVVFLYGFYYYRFKIKSTKYGLYAFYLGVGFSFVYQIYQLVSFSMFDFSLPLSDPLKLPLTFRQGANVGGYEAMLYDFGIPPALIVPLKSNRIVRTAAFTPELSYLSTIILPLIFLAKSRMIKLVLSISLLLTISKNAMATLLFLAIYGVIRKFGVKSSFLLHFLIMIVITAAAMFVAPTAIEKFGPTSTYFGRFYPYYAYTSVAHNNEKFTGIGYIRLQDRFGDRMSEKPATHFGGILIELGIVGFLLYIGYLAEFVKKSRNHYAAYSLIIMVFNYFYFTTWPIFTFYAALLLTREKSN